jgi:glycosyltransferase involved in cell wall biosynthesis
LETGLNADVVAALRASEEAALACARHVVASSTTTMRILAEDFHVPRERISVVEPGTDQPALRPCKQRGTVNLLSVGAVVPRKGYDVLVAALAKIRHLSWRLVVVGDRTRSVSTAERLSAQILHAGLADRISLHGVVSAHELSSLYAQADLFVLPSRFEGYGMAFTEAIAHGVPVVGTRVGAIAHTVPDKTGVLVPPDDPDALAMALQGLIENEAERERLAAAARGTNFPSWQKQGARFARVLESL